MASHSNRERFALLSLTILLLQAAQPVPTSQAVDPATLGLVADILGIAGAAFDVGVWVAGPHSDDVPPSVSGVSLDTKDDGDGIHVGDMFDVIVTADIYTGMARSGSANANAATIKVDVQFEDKKVSKTLQREGGQRLSGELFRVTFEARKEGRADINAQVSVTGWCECAGISEFLFWTVGLDMQMGVLHVMEFYQIAGLIMAESNPIQVQVDRPYRYLPQEPKDINHGDKTEAGIEIENLSQKPLHVIIILLNDGSCIEEYVFEKHDGRTVSCEARGTPVHSLGESLIETFSVIVDANISLETGGGWLGVKSETMEYLVYHPKEVAFSHFPDSWGVLLDANNLEPSEGTEVDFTVTITGELPADSERISYQWDWGDGSLSEVFSNVENSFSAAHAYSEDGSWIATLYAAVRDPETGAVTVIGEEQIQLGVRNANPAISSSSFTAETVEVGDTVSFDFEVIDPVPDALNYTMNFGDGASTSGVGSNSLAINEMHTYTTYGNFTYFLVVADDDGGSSLRTGNILVLGDPPSANPRGQYTGLEGATITFDGSESMDLDGRITLYAWDFGDGSVGVGRTVEHAYNHSGSYIGRLMVLDDSSLIGEEVFEVIVKDTSPFIAEIGTFVDGTKVVFGADAAILEPDRTLTYDWNFGDGVTGKGLIVNHTYASAGSYSVKLIVSDGQGNTVSLDKIVEVTGFPVSNLALAIGIVLVAIVVVGVMLVRRKRKTNI